MSSLLQLRIQWIGLFHPDQTNEINLQNLYNVKLAYAGYLQMIMLLCFAPKNVDGDGLIFGGGVVLGFQVGERWLDIRSSCVVENRVLHSSLFSLVEFHQKWSSSARMAFPPSLMHSKNCASKCVVLVGDAAHTVHPLAGQGVNLGFGDAFPFSRVNAKVIAVDTDIGEVHHLLDFLII
ncbi:hypothetical protein GH714_022380 [Hevea brasiliensis]|uniref:FAD-binding domain-containing protein n=1 Tax=Hevea brasiliensis TaxID=3981 RepID=A0A6A6MP11_HEVBR|nr:hypothetical protein GH714_022380 [Hevea brasiliensis]